MKKTLVSLEWLDIPANPTGADLIRRDIARAWARGRRFVSFVPSVGNAFHETQAAAEKSADRRARKACPGNPPTWEVSPLKLAASPPAYPHAHKATMKNYHGQEEDINAGDHVMHVTDSGKICRAYVQRADGDLLELQFSDEHYGCELKSSCWKDEN